MPDRVRSSAKRGMMVGMRIFGRPAGEHSRGREPGGPARDLDPRCAELATIGADVNADPEPRAGDRSACEECTLLGEHHWSHLRICLTCGHVGCCDSSPRRHAAAHFEETGHPVMRSVEPGEVWRWCYVHQLAD